MGLLDIPINSLHHRLMAGYTPYPLLGLSGGGFPLPYTHGKTHVKIYVKTLPRGSGGRVAGWAAAWVGGGWWMLSGHGAGAASYAACVQMGVVWWVFHCVKK